MNKEVKNKKRTKLRNKKLLKKYPWLTPYNVWTGKLNKNYNYEYTWYDDIPRGWQISFGKLLLEDLDKASKGHIFLEQIKEKYGELRIYAVTTKEAQDIIGKYETISRNVCIDCGRPNVGYITSGWIEPTCKRCFDRYKDDETISYEDYIDTEDTEIHKSIKYTQFGKEYPNGRITIEKDISDTVDKIIRRWNKRYKEI